MKNGYLFVWLFTLLLASSLCQHYKNIIIAISSIISIAVCVILFSFDRIKSYKKSGTSHHILMIIYEISAIICVTCLLMVLSIFVWNENDGVNFIIYLSTGIPLLPIIFNTSYVNASKK